MTRCSNTDGRWARRISAARFETDGCLRFEQIREAVFAAAEANRGLNLPPHSGTGGQAASDAGISRQVGDFDRTGKMCGFTNIHRDAEAMPRAVGRRQMIAELHQEERSFAGSRHRPGQIRQPAHLVEQLDQFVFRSHNQIQLFHRRRYASAPETKKTRRPGWPPR